MPSIGSETIFYKSLAKKIKKAQGFLKSPWGISLIFLCALLFFLIFWFSPIFLNYLQNRFNQKFVFFNLTEPFMAMVKFSLTCLIILLFPLVWLGVLSLLNSFILLAKKKFLFFYFLGLILFYVGVFFAYFIILPYGVNFLLSFQTEEVKPAISLQHFSNFFSFFLLLFGLIFELPLIMIFLTLMRILSPNHLRRYRKEIFFGIVVFSAVITPTPDAVNMSLLSIPLYFLFELGLILSRMIERKPKIKG